MKKSFLILLIAFCVGFAAEFVPIAAIHESGSIVNTTYFNAGGAFPANAASLSLNPAMPAGWHYFSQSMMSVFGSYYKNSDMDYYKTGGGGSLALGMGRYIGLEYNLKKEKDDPEQKFHRGTIAFGTMIDDNDEDPLFIGINLSFYNFAGNSSRSGLLPVKHDTVGHGTSINYYDGGVRSVWSKNNFIATDLGFYQPGSGKRLSWAIVLENILGYSWNEHDYILKHERSEKTYIGEIEETIERDTTKYIYGYKDTITIKRDSAFYVAGNHKSSNFLNKKYNSFLLSTNVSIPVIDDKVLLMIPADIRFWGFMNKPLRRSSKVKHRTEVHSGFELQFGKKICGRFGWAWVPEEYTTAENGQLNFSGWDNRFSGGFGVNIGIITLDALFAKETFGIGLSFQM